MLDSINHFFTQLTFIRPWAFFLLLPALALFLWQYAQPHHNTNWAKLIDKHLLDWIVPNTQNNKSHKKNHYLLLIFWLLATFALSGPSWEKLPNPIYSSQNASVIVLDLSRSMKAKDTQPSRLDRAKYKISDILQEADSGQMGFVVYAGDGFILSPLTSDKKTIENLLAPLSPSLMPLLGSQPQKGIEKAIELLTNAQQPQGTIIWITDGAESHQLEDIESLLKDNNRYQLRILAVGTAQGSPIPMESGRYLRDSNNKLIVPQLNYDELAKFADKTQSILTPVTANNDDVELLLAQYMLLDDNFKKEDLFSDTWHDAGYWLIFLMLPIALYAFRQKGLITMLVLNGLLISSYSTPAMAESSNNSSVADKIFLNQDQRAQKHFEQEKYQEAQSNFKNKRWKAAAAYKNGDYDSAIRLNDTPETASDYYNRANAHALNESYQDAIEEYKKALEIDSEHSDSMHNKKIVEQLLQQQQEEQNKKEQQEKEEQKKKDEQQKQESDKDSKDPQKDEEQKEPKDQQSEEQDEKQKKEQQQAEMKELTDQEKEQEIEQLLKRINDDPGRLLRNKMKLEYNRRGSRHAPSKTW